MRLEYFLLAEAAVAHNGKVYVHGGGVTEIEVPQIPWTHPQLAVVLRLAATEDEASEPHEVGLAVVDPEGASLMPRYGVKIRPSTRAPKVPRDERFYDLTLTLSPLVLGCEGVYRIMVDIDGEPAREMQLPVILDDSDFELLEADVSS